MKYRIQVFLNMLFVQFGQKADYYKQDQSEFSHKSLLRDFGANEKLADEMLTDKGILLERTHLRAPSITPETNCTTILWHFTFFLLAEHRTLVYIRLEKKKSDIFIILNGFLFSQA